MLYVVGAAYAACHLFSGRAAFLIVDAMIATIMSANVFFWIIPGQRITVASMKAGEPVDAIHGQRAKQRSVHNTYFTLPVLLAMLSNHYSMTYKAARLMLHHLSHVEAALQFDGSAAEGKKDLVSALLM